MEKETQDPIVTSRVATDSIENARSTSSRLIDPKIVTEFSQNFYYVI